MSHNNNSSPQFAIAASGGNDTFNQLVKNAIAEKQVIGDDSSRYSMGHNQDYQQYEESKVSETRKTFNVYNDIDQIDKILPKQHVGDVSSGSNEFDQ